MKATGLLGLLVFLAASTAWAEDDTSAFERQAALFAEKCAKCHTVGLGDRVGPDLKDVSKRRERAWLVGFIRSPETFFENDEAAKEMLAQFDNVKMPELGISEKQAEELLDHITTLSEGPAGMGAEDVFIPGDPRRRRVTVPEEGGGTNPLCLALLFLFAGGAGVLWKTGRPRCAQVLLVLAATSAYGAFGGMQHHRLVGVDQGYEPVQPIDFSHRLHAGELEIACLYCHHGADRGPVAGIPPVSTCMNCHRIVKKRSDAKEPSAEIAKVVETWETRNTDAPRSIEWVRVHRLPDFVTFHHAAHVRNGIECQECHGPVETMDRIRQSSDLTMGWCVNCHRHDGREAPTHWKRAKGALDCAVCHQ